MDREKRRTANGVYAPTFKHRMLMAVGGWNGAPPDFYVEGSQGKALST